MIVRFLSFVLLALTLTTSAVQAEPTAPAEARDCNDDEIAVPDERGDGNLCLKKSEWERAKAICDALEPGSDPLGCTCQDGDEVSACGD